MGKTPNLFKFNVLKFNSNFTEVTNEQKNVKRNG